MPTDSYETNAAGGGKVKSALSAIRRLPLLRRSGSSDKVQQQAPSSAASVRGGRRDTVAPGSLYDADGHYDAPLGQTASRDYHHHQALPDDDDEPSPAPTADDSFEAPKFKLNSASPASELPKS